LTARLGDGLLHVRLGQATGFGVFFAEG